MFQWWINSGNGAVEVGETAVQGVATKLNNDGSKHKVTKNEWRRATANDKITMKNLRQEGKMKSS